MPFWSCRSELLNGPAELADLEDELRAAADRFGRDIAKHASRRATGPRVGPVPTRLPSLPFGRPVRMRPARPQRLRSGTPPTILERDRPGAGRSPLAEAVEHNAERVERSIRERLPGLRRALEDLGRRIGGRGR